MADQVDPSEPEATLSKSNSDEAREERFQEVVLESYATLFQKVLVESKPQPTSWLDILKPAITMAICGAVLLFGLSIATNSFHKLSEGNITDHDVLDFYQAQNELYAQVILEQVAGVHATLDTVARNQSRPEVVYSQDAIIYSGGHGRDQRERMTQVSLLDQFEALNMSQGFASKLNSLYNPDPWGFNRTPPVFPLSSPSPEYYNVYQGEY